MQKVNSSNFYCESAFCKGIREHSKSMGRTGVGREREREKNIAKLSKRVGKISKGKTRSLRKRLEQENDVDPIFMTEINITKQQQFCLSGCIFNIYSDNTNSRYYNKISHKEHGLRQINQRRGWWCRLNIVIRSHWDLPHTDSSITRKVI